MPTSRAWRQWVCLRSGAIGVLFLFLAVLSALASYSDASGARHTSGHAIGVKAPAKAVDSVFLLVEAPRGRARLPSGRAPWQAPGQIPATDRV